MEMKAISMCRSMTNYPLSTNLRDTVYADWICYILHISLTFTISTLQQNERGPVIEDEEPTYFVDTNRLFESDYAPFYDRDVNAQEVLGQQQLFRSSQT
jgi:hypothetical protein